MKVVKRTFFKHNCLRCGRSFESEAKKPLRCGKCKSPYWNKERSNGIPKQVR